MIRNILLAAAALSVSLSSQAAPPQTAPELFNLNKVWNAKLTFGADQWQAIKPEEPQGGGFPGGPGGPGGPPGGGGPGRPGGGRGPGGSGGPGGGFGPGNFMAGGFLTALDADKDGSVSRDEFTGGFSRWFKEWDAKKAGSLSSQDMQTGLNRALMPAPPPGGGGGGMPNFSLQGQNGARNGMSGMRGIHFDYVHADLAFEGASLSNVAVRYKGNGTYMDAMRTDKKSLKVDLNEFAKKQKLAGLTKLNFHNNITDGGWMNEPLAYNLYRDAGVPAPRSSYLRLTVDVPGTYTNHYLGLYSIVENPDNNWAEDRFSSKKGLILKPVTRELFKFQGEDWAAYQQAYDPKTDITEKQKQRVFDFAKLMSNSDDAEFAKRLPEFLDVDEFTRFMAVTVWLSNTDSILMMGQNFIVYLNPKTDRFQFVPWDLDRAFGNFFNPSPEQMSIREAWGADNFFLNRVMKDETVKKAYLARMEEFQKTLFRPERLAKQVDELAAILRSSVRDEGAAKVERFDKVVAGEAAESQPFGGGPGGFRMPSAPPIKSFTKARHQSVADQLAGKAEGVSLNGGPGRPGGPGRRGGPGGSGPGGDFGPGNFVAPVFLKAADVNSDGKVSESEFTALAAKWFKEWDKKSTGKLAQDDLVAGLNAVIPPPDFGGPGPGG